MKACRFQARTNSSSSMQRFGLLLLFLFTLLRLCCSEMAIAGLSLGKGLTKAEEKALLDEHNVLRSRQARGEVPNQPPAADMVRLVSLTKSLLSAE